MAETYTFALPGYENIPFSFQPYGMNARIYCGGKLWKQTRGKFRGTLPNGQEIVLGLKYSIDIFHPKITYNGQTLTVIPPLPKYQMILGYLPLILVAMGGALGGLLGAIGSYINFSVFRGKAKNPAKVTISLLITFVTFLVYGVLGSLVHAALK